MITLFGTAKPFTGTTAIQQRNALASWKRLHPQAEVLLMGRGEGAAEAAADLGLTYLPDVPTNELGTPLISGMFETAQRVGRWDLQVYCNCDILLLDDVLPALRRIPFDGHWMAAGQRWDLDLADALPFGLPDWPAYVRRLVRERGRLHPATGSDYFAYPRGLWTEMPPFAVGRVDWDNWMFYACLQRAVPIVDLTPSATVVHQNHGAYMHSYRDNRGTWRGTEADRNRELAGRMGARTTLYHATHLQTRWGTVPNLRPMPLLAKLVYISWQHPERRNLGRLVRVLRAVDLAIQERTPPGELLRRSWDVVSRRIANGTVRF